MNLEAILTYYTHHSESIIQWVVLIILLLSGSLIARNIFSKKAAGDDSSSPELRDAIQKILDQTAKLEAVSIDKLSAQGVAGFDGELQALKADLAARESELAKLKAGGGKPGEDAATVNARIKELEAKLAEYEILEDDIADLSLYKEENVRLRSEVEKFKAGGAAPAAVAPVAAPASSDLSGAIEEDSLAALAAEPEPTTVVEGDDAILEEFAQAVGQQDTGTAPATVEIPDTGNPMADFESAVKAEKQMQDPVTVVKGEAPAPTEVTVVKGTAPGKNAQGEADDLFAEFSSGIDEAGAGETLDTDKMMAEMAALVNMEPAKGSALEENIDTDKMAAEATTLNKS